MTVLDNWDRFKARYISRKEKTDNKKEEYPKDVLVPSGFNNEKNNMYEEVVNGKPLTPTLMRKIALSDSLFTKGCEKKYMDVFRAWFTFEKFETRKEMPLIEKKIIWNFDRRTGIRKKFQIAAVCSAIYGNGYILKSYLNDQYLEDGKEPNLSLPVREGATPYQLYLLNPEKVTEIKAIEGKKDEFMFEYKNSIYKTQYIHSSRIIHIKENELPFTNFGISKITILRHIINSKAEIDIATGKILSWFSHGIPEWRKMEGEITPKILKDMENTLKNHPDYFATSSQYKLEMHNPEAIDPRPFYEYVIQNIAAVLVMPVSMLVGVQVGKVTGAETQFSDYYRDVRDIQDMIYTPLLENLYEELLAAYGREFNYNIVWNEIYVNENAEADLDAKRAGTVSILKGANVVDLKEARDMMNKGHVKLDVEKEIEQLSQSTLPFNDKEKKEKEDKKELEK